jgi:outer membrane protein OmpA-like peptidoglycan-associated protein
VRTPAPALPAAAAPPPPTKTQSANQFIQRRGQKPSAGLDAVRKERRTTTDGSRTIIREGNRTIVRDGNRAVIHHNEADRFAVGARKVTVERKNNEIISVILRAAGISIVTTTDRDGRLLRRVRRDRNGRDTVIIDNSFAGARRGDYFVDLPPPRYRGPRDRYILDAGRANRSSIYGIFLAPPIEHIERRYTLDQVRYNQPLREYMPRVDLDVNFASGSWQLSPSQIDELSVIADGLNRAIGRNPREVFLIEGHTDAVGSNEDNLSLSDRRAEAVAVVLTEEFGVPPENLVTQGYGEEYLKVDTEGPSRENRRVAIRRITPLIDRTAGR